MSLIDLVEQNERDPNARRIFRRRRMQLRQGRWTALVVIAVIVFGAVAAGGLRRGGYFLGVSARIFYTPLYRIIGALFMKDQGTFLVLRRFRPTKRGQVPLVKHIRRAANGLGVAFSVEDASYCG